MNVKSLHQLIEYNSDREGFAKHGKRSTVQADDVKLLVRRSKWLVGVKLFFKLCFLIMTKLFRL